VRQVDRITRPVKLQAICHRVYSPAAATRARAGGAKTTEIQAPRGGELGGSADALRNAFSQVEDRAGAFDLVVLSTAMVSSSMTSAFERR
jgi:hypothetical protein